MLNTATGNVSTLKNLLISNAARLPLHINPHAATAETAVEQFACEYGLYLDRLHQVNTMAAFLYPNASVEHLTIIGKMMFLLFYIDDKYGDLPSSQGIEAPNDELVVLVRACCAAFMSERQLVSVCHPLVEAFCYIRQAMECCATKNWLYRFGCSLRDHLLCSIMPNTYGWESECQNISSYVVIREHISGMYPTVDFIEFASGKFLSDSDFLQPWLQRMRICCVQIASLSNDLFSYHKEVMCNGLLMNLVSVMQKVHLCTFNQAITQSVDLINEVTTSFFEYDQMLLHSSVISHDSIPAYIQGLKYQLSASWHWQMNTNRYRSTESPFIELQQFIA